MHVLLSWMQRFGSKSHYKYLQLGKLLCHFDLHLWPSVVCVSPWQPAGWYCLFLLLLLIFGCHRIAFLYMNYELLSNIDVLVI